MYELSKNIGALKRSKRGFNRLNRKLHSSIINRPKSARKRPPKGLRKVLSRVDFEFIYFESLVFIGAFLAMDIRSNNYSQQIIAWPLIIQALFGYFLFLILKKHFSGIGGRLGLMAFIISLTSLLCKFMMDHYL